MKLKILLFLVVVLLTNCGKEAEQLEIAFNKVLNYQSSEELQQLLSSSSIKYLQDVMAISDTFNFDKADHIGLLKHCRLTTMRLHGQAVKYLANDESETTETRSPEDKLLMLMAFTGTGPIAVGAKERIKFEKVTGRNGDKRSISVLISTGGNNTFLQSEYDFEKEGEEWKLDLPSTFSLEERLLKQQFKRAGRGVTRAEFMSNYLENMPETMEFQYNTRKVR